MARIRSIKPETWSDEKFVELSPLARLLFMALWNFCDDFGRIQYSPRQIKLRCLPADCCDVSELIGEIRREKMVELYEVDNKQYLSVCNFQKHQKVDRRNPSKLPPPPNSPVLSRKNPPDQGRDQGSRIKDLTPKSPSAFVEDSPNDEGDFEDFENDLGAAKISGRRCDGTNSRALGTNPRTRTDRDREAQRRRNMAFSAIYETHSHLGPLQINAILDARDRGETHPDDPNAQKPPDPQPDRVAAVVAGAANALKKPG